MRLLTAPIDGLLWVFGHVLRQAEEAMYDEDALRERLIQLHRDLEAGALSEEEFERREAELAALFEEAEARERRKG